jgi:hypothetical protein
MRLGEILDVDPRHLRLWNLERRRIPLASKTSSIRPSTILSLKAPINEFKVFNLQDLHIFPIWNRTFCVSNTNT